MDPVQTSGWWSLNRTLVRTKNWLSGSDGFLHFSLNRLHEAWTDPVNVQPSHTKSYNVLCRICSVFPGAVWGTHHLLIIQVQDSTYNPNCAKSAQNWKHWVLSPVWVTMEWCKQQNICIVLCSKLLVSYASVAPEWCHNLIITCCTTIREMRCLRHKIHMGLFCAFGLSALHWIISKSIPGKQRKIYGFIHKDLKI